MLGSPSLFLQPPVSPRALSSASPLLAQPHCQLFAASVLVRPGWALGPQIPGPPRHLQPDGLWSAQLLHVSPPSPDAAQKQALHSLPATTPAHGCLSCSCLLPGLPCAPTPLRHSCHAPSILQLLKPGGGDPRGLVISYKPAFHQNHPILPGPATLKGLWFHGCPLRSGKPSCPCCVRSPCQPCPLCTRAGAEFCTRLMSRPAPGLAPTRSSVRQ